MQERECDLNSTTSEVQRGQDFMLEDLSEAIKVFQKSELVANYMVRNLDRDRFKPSDENTLKDGPELLSPTKIGDSS